MAHCCYNDWLRKRLLCTCYCATLHKLRTKISDISWCHFLAGYFSSSCGCCMQNIVKEISLRESGTFSPTALTSHFVTTMSLAPEESSEGTAICRQWWHWKLVPQSTSEFFHPGYPSFRGPLGHLLQPPRQLYIAYVFRIYYFLFSILAYNNTIKLLVRTDCNATFIWVTVIYLRYILCIFSKKSVIQNTTVME